MCLAVAAAVGLPAATLARCRGSADSMTSLSCSLGPNGCVDGRLPLAAAQDYWRRKCWSAAVWCADACLEYLYCSIHSNYSLRLSSKMKLHFGQSWFPVSNLTAHTAK